MPFRPCDMCHVPSRYYETLQVCDMPRFDFPTPKWRVMDLSANQVDAAMLHSMADAMMRVRVYDISHGRYYHNTNWRSTACKIRDMQIS